MTLFDLDGTKIQTDVTNFLKKARTKKITIHYKTIYGTIRNDSGILDSFDENFIFLRLDERHNDRVRLFPLSDVVKIDYSRY